MRSRQTAAFLLGLVVALASYGIDGWWLDSGSGVLHATLGLFLVGVLVALLQRRTPWASGILAWVGCMLGMIGILFRVGPGTIWPIVLVVAAGISAAAVLAGTLAAVAAHRLRP